MLRCVKTGIALVVVVAAAGGVARSVMGAICDGCLKFVLHFVGDLFEIDAGGRRRCCRCNDWS